MILNWKKPKAGVNVIPVLKNGVIVDNIMLLPGHNQIKDELWEDMKKQAGVKRHIEAGNLEEVVEVKKDIIPVRTRKGKEPTAPPKEKITENKTIHEMSAKKAKEIVQDTWVLDTLEEWLEYEGRDEIRAAISNQIEEVKNPTIPKKDK